MKVVQLMSSEAAGPGKDTLLSESEFHSLCRRLGVVLAYACSHYLFKCLAEGFSLL
jgi:hypothetical protein